MKICLFNPIKRPAFPVGCVMAIVTIMIAFLPQLARSQSYPIKVLAIGNSFSEDAVEQNLYELAHAQGDSIVIGNAFIGGCTIDRHWDNATTGKKDYSYRKIVGGKKTAVDDMDLVSIIKDEPWDIITLQQQSGRAGIPDTYSNLNKLKDFVLNNATNKGVEIVWHTTWAYAKNAESSEFKRYNNDQRKMYNSIQKTISDELSKVGIKRNIPSGTAIQKARAVVGDVLNRDGTHLSYTMGRYVAACTWCEFITGKNIVGNPFHPTDIPAETAKLLQSTAHKANVSNNENLADSLRVLWIGNSYTFYNDLPEMVQKIAATKGMNLSMTKILKGGEKFSGHLKNDNLIKELSQGAWDYVILQEYSSTPGYSTQTVAKEVYPYAQKLDSLAKSGSPDVKVIYYMTWGHKHGNNRQTAYPLDDTYELMQDRIKTTYLEMAYENGSWCAPVGMAWQKVRNEQPNIQLYDPDLSHPSIMGSYLAANTIFTTIYRKPYQTNFTAGIPSELAEYLQRVAEETVLDNQNIIYPKEVN